MQQALFPMKNLRITQGYDQGSHRGSYAIDIAGKDQGIENAYAPFDGVIKRKYTVGNSVWFESLNKVKYADGTEDFAVVMFTHDSNTDNIKVGQVFKQGEVIYQEGTANASANHIHLECGRGKFSGTGWQKTGYVYQGVETYTISNRVKPQDMLFVDGVEILNGGGYKWSKSMGIFTEGVRKDFNIIEFGKDMGWFKEQVGKDFRDAYYAIKDSEEYRREHYMTKGDLQNMLGRIPTVAECDEFQIELGPDRAKAGGGTVWRTGVYRLKDQKKLQGTNGNQTKPTVLKAGVYEVK